MKKSRIILISVFMLAQGWMGRTANAAIGADILRAAILPRAIAMGGAYIAMAEDIDSIQYNPAGLAPLAKNELCFVHIAGLIDSREYFAFSKPLKAGGVIGGSFLFRGMPEIANAEAVDETGARAEPVASRDMIIALSYGWGIKTITTIKSNDLGLGMNVKWLRSELANKEASAIALDLGVWWQPIEMPLLKTGLVIQNLGTSLKFEGEEDALPLNLGVGLNYLAYRDDTNSWKLLFDINYPMDETIMKLNAGTEFWFKQLIAIRVGYQYENESAASGIQAGLGVKYPIANILLNINYAYKPMQLSQALNDAEHSISITIGF